MSRPVTGYPQSGATGDYSGASSYLPAAQPLSERTRSGGGEREGWHDTASLMGIPDTELTPRVQRAVIKLVAELRSLHDELARARDRIGHLTELADQDGLTPTLNRRAFLRELNRLRSFALRYGIGGSVVYFDVNGMKQINDRLGHQAGDGALVHVAQTMNRLVRDSDVFGRLGGDEFGLILAQADRAAAERKAESLLEALAREPYRFAEREVPLRLAYGVHRFDAKETAEEILDAADRAMYVQKAAPAAPSVEPKTAKAG